MIKQEEYQQQQDERIAEVLTQKLDDFQQAMLNIANDAISGVYGDVLPYIVTDTEANIGYRVEGSLRNILSGKFEDISTDKLKPFIKVADSYGGYSCLHMSQYNDMCLNVYNLCKGDIENNVVAGLQQRVKDLEERLTEAYRCY